MFRNAVPLVRILGFEIRVDPSWLLIAALLIWSLSTGYFPVMLPEQSPGVYFVLGVAAMLGLFGSLLLRRIRTEVLYRERRTRWVREMVLSPEGGA